MDYVSNSLCHFVGRSQKTDEDRYQLLLKIIKENKLLADINNPNNPSLKFSTRYKGTHVGEVIEQCSCVCFCDIPDEALDIHINKYSKFGIGFEKTFLTQQGVRPVLYVPANSLITEYSSTNTPKQAMDYYLTLFKQATYLYTIMSLINQAYPFNALMASLITKKPELEKYIIKLIDPTVLKKFLDGKSHEMLFNESVAWGTLFSYIKVFDENLPQNHQDNYYMEREWRSIRNVEFTLDNIKKIYLPSKEYCKRFSEEFPSYKGSYYIFTNEKLL